jgi:hypothetical protein
MLHLDSGPKPVPSFHEGLRYLVPNKLAFVSGSLSHIEGLRQKLSGALFLSSDLHQRYIPLARDFGPVNLSVVHRFCMTITKAISKAGGRTLVYCIDPSPESQTNAAFLLGAFLILHEGWSPDDAVAPFLCSTAPFALLPFRDAAFSMPAVELPVAACLAGLARAAAIWFDWRVFDRAAYEVNLSCKGRGENQKKGKETA